MGHKYLSFVIWLNKNSSPARCLVAFVFTSFVVQSFQGKSPLSLIKKKKSFRNLEKSGERERGQKRELGLRKKIPRKITKGVESKGSHAQQTKPLLGL